MSLKFNPEEVDACFELFMRFNGTNFAEIEKEMHRRGFVTFKAARLKSKGFGENRREGWIEYFGWDNSLKLKAATAGLEVQTSAESLLGEVEGIRKKLYTELQAKGVTGHKDLIYQHRDYVDQSTKILDRLKDARDNYRNYLAMLHRLLAAAPKISPQLARELILAEDALIEWGREELASEYSEED